MLTSSVLIILRSNIEYNDKLILENLFNDKFINDIWTKSQKKFAIKKFQNDKIFESKRFVINE